MTHRPLLDPRQCRAARSLLGWSQADLAAKSGTGISTVSDFERNARDTKDTVIYAVALAFNKAGISFYADNHGMTVHLRR